MLRPIRFAAVVLGILFLAGCYGIERIDFESVGPTDPEKPVPEGHSIVAGNVRFIANSKAVAYTAFRRPYFRLVRREDFLYYETPENDYAVQFPWTLPYGNYYAEILSNMLVICQPMKSRLHQFQQDAITT